MLAPGHLSAAFTAASSKLSPRDDTYVPSLATLVLQEARRQRASDVHLVPEESRLRMQFRIDGVLHSIASFDRELGNRLVARLKVLAGLLTYRTEIPQEGRVAREHSDQEIRISTFPTLYGEKAAVRLFADNNQLHLPHELGLPHELQHSLLKQLSETAGVILFTGPSGSGKTTTAYACLREILQQSHNSRCVMTLEDPIEVALPGVTQAQVRENAGFDLATGIRSLMRQDPDVILVGEIRDSATAEAVFQAALTGHLVLSTFHAGSAVEALARLLEMQLEPYLIRSALRLILCQRLLRRCCTCAAHPTPSGQHGTCSTCSGTGFHGRLVLAEGLQLDSQELVDAFLQRADARRLQALAAQQGLMTLQQRALQAVAAGQTTREEVLRVLGSAPQCPSAQ